MEKSLLVQIYIGYFGRAPDPEGLNFWIEVLEDGMTLEAIAQDFARQPEALALYPTLDKPDEANFEAFLTSVYDNLFGREPDAAGLAFWTAFLEDGGSIGTAILEVINGAVGTDVQTLDEKVSVATAWTDLATQLPEFVLSEEAIASSRSALALIDPSTTAEGSEAFEAQIEFFDTLSPTDPVEPPSEPNEPADPPTSPPPIIQPPVNQAPTVALSNEVITLPEDAHFTTRTKVADIAVSDDGRGTNQLSLSGADAALFEIDGTELYLLPCTALDFAINPTLDVTVSVDDTGTGGTPDGVASLSIAVPASADFGAGQVSFDGAAQGVIIDLRTDANGLQFVSGGDTNGDVISGLKGVIGTDHDDFIVGDENSNHLTGGLGADTFVFASELENGSIDCITDFDTAQDVIGLEARLFSGGTALADIVLGEIDGASFQTNTTGLAETADHRVIYNSNSGQLFYDADGVGGENGVAFAQLKSGLDLGTANIELVADFNRAPVAADLAVTVSASDIGIIALPVGDVNLTDTPSFNLSAGHGSVDGLNNLVFDPEGDFDSLMEGQTATEVLTYSVTDLGGLSDSGTVTVTVEGVNDAPVAEDDAPQTMSEDTQIVLTPLDNDSDVDAGDVIKIVSVGAVANGNAEVAPDGLSITFTPGTDFVGDVTLEYTIEDTFGARDTAELEITVENANDDPVAAAVAGTVDQGASIVVTPDFTDIDLGDTHTISVDTTGTVGTASVNPDGTIAYSAEAFESLTQGETGTDTFTYIVTDAGGRSSTATATVQVRGLNDAVVATSDIVAGTEDETIILSPLANDIDGDAGSTLRITELFNVINGTATIAADGQTISFVPDENFEGETRFDYEVTSSDGTTDRATITMTFAPVNDAPVVLGMDLYALAGTPTVQIVPTVFDPDLNETFIMYVQTDGSFDSTAAEVYVTKAGEYRYSPNEYDPAEAYVINYQNFYPVEAAQTDVFTITVQDVGGLSGTATITSTVSDAPSAPYFPENSRGGYAPEDETRIIELNFQDINLADTYEVSGLRNVVNGEASINTAAGAPPSIVFTSDEDFFGRASFEVQVTDSSGLSTEWTQINVSVFGTPDPIDVIFEATAASRADAFYLSVDGAIPEGGVGSYSRVTDITLTAVDANGVAFANQSDFFDVASYPILDNTAPYWVRSTGPDPFLVKIPDYIREDFSVEATYARTDQSGGGTGIGTFDVNVTHATHDLSQTFGFNDASLWGPGASTTHSAGFDLGGEFGVTLGSKGDIFQGGGTFAGVGATAHVGYNTSASVDAGALISTEVWIDGGDVDGGLNYSANVSSIRNDATDQLTFDTSAAVNVPSSWFAADSPNAGFNLSLEDVFVGVEAYFQLGGYAHVHWGAGTSGPEMDFKIDTGEIDLGVPEIDIINYDGTTFSVLNGLVSASGNNINKTFTSPGLGNELVNVNLTKPVLTTHSTTNDGTTLSGSNNADFLNLEIDLDGIIATAKSIKNPVSQHESLDLGLIKLSAGYDALDVDVRTDLNYQQSNSLTPGDLDGVLHLEDGSEFAFVFGETLTFGDASAMDVNGDGSVGYFVEMTPSAEFQTRAEMIIDIYDHFSVFDAYGSLELGIEIPGLPSSFSLGTGGPLYSRDGLLLDETFAVPLTTQGFALDLNSVQSGLLFA